MDQEGNRSALKKRRKIHITGTVQGVGFRPFIYNRANESGLTGFVANSTSGVIIEVEGEETILNDFREIINKNKPASAKIHSFHESDLLLCNDDEFKIKPSVIEKSSGFNVLPDLAMCDDCKRELFDRSDRRYLYPFINCTNCGPRYSIIESMPYDRPGTTMREFEMCDNCGAEYKNPADRRFHAQPVACPDCGPELALVNNSGNTVSGNNEALENCAELLKAGYIISLKSIGGFQILADAANREAVSRLREKKRRKKKAFAMLFPDIETVEEICHVSQMEKELLQSTIAPVILLKRKYKDDPYSLSAPGNPYYGIMLPFSPLHHLLLEKFGGPLIATSGNASEEPICISIDEALRRTGHIADYFLTHNRKIVRPVDDSIVRFFDDKPTVLRRARGYAPSPVYLNINDNDKTILAFGAYYKNSISIKKDKRIITSQHIGDLSNLEATENFERNIKDICALNDVTPDLVVSDIHPDYYSTQSAKKTGLPRAEIQHHIAHFASCYMENNISTDYAGFIWDGTGLGTDGRIWGGETFLLKNDKPERALKFRDIMLPGGDKAITQPFRSAIAVLFDLFDKEVPENVLKKLPPFSFDKSGFIIDMLRGNTNCFPASSAGRLFDAVSSLLGLVHINEYEGHAAAELEYICENDDKSFYPVRIAKNTVDEFDWRSVVMPLLEDIFNGEAASVISNRFHNSLAHLILDVSFICGSENVLFSGGCFQNFRLVTKAKKLLEQNGFRVYLNRNIPPNDGGISFGQIAAKLNGWEV